MTRATLQSIGRQALTVVLLALAAFAYVTMVISISLSILSPIYTRAPGGCPTVSDRFLADVLMVVFRKIPTISRATPTVALSKDNSESARSRQGNSLTNLAELQGIGI